ncbi:50S ribosomal protein L23 [Candidatus Peregrinibacteria bacterium]|nr:50S ribosomal protein L23 [Candidatus Peregrinibacteria bacterium]MBI3815925.1 50S ribosomal protein L23 [Candidatus Peregrinibacteria bacterium]
MDLTSVIAGPVVTEKAERLKAQGPRRTYTLQIHPSSTKIDVKKALKKYFDVEAVSVRIGWVRPKQRSLQGAGMMEKRHRSKRAIVTVSEKSKPLDLSAFEAQG